MTRVDSRGTWPWRGRMGRVMRRVAGRAGTAVAKRPLRRSSSAHEHRAERGREGDPHGRAAVEWQPEALHPAREVQTCSALGASVKWSSWMRDQAPDQPGDRRDGADHPEREPLGQHPGSEHDLGVGPSLTIATQDLVAAGLRPRQARMPDQEQKHEPSNHRRAGQPGADRVRELVHALELERTRRRAAEDLAAPSGPTRSRPWKALCGRCKPITPPRRPTPTAPLPH
jgi:hypothetical protein